MTKDLKEMYNMVFEVPTGKRKSNFSRYFYTYQKADFKKKIDGLYKEYYTVRGDYLYDAEEYAAVVKDVVSRYTSNKDALIDVLKAYNGYLEHEHGLEIKIDYPPIPISNTFERLMFIAKFLQDRNHKISELPDLLWQSSRTIEGDLAKLQGRDGDALQVCGREFIVDEMSRSRGRMDFGSTVHPFFLTCNLTQVIVTLEGLKEMCKKPEYKGYALPMAQSIWEQLSDYGKERIYFVTENLLNQEVSWYKTLDGKDSHSFHTERECSQMGEHVLIDCLKNGEKRTCVIEYGDATHKEFLEEVSIIELLEEGWKVSVAGKEQILDREKIIRCSYHKENMY